MVRPGWLRKRKLEAKLDPEVYAQRFRDQWESILEQVGVEWTDQAAMSEKVKRVVEGLGVPGCWVAPYLCFGREMLAITKKFSGIYAGDETIEAIDVWTTRGLSREILNLLAYRFGAWPVWKTPDPDLVLCYNFDRGVGVEALDLSGFNHPGVIVGPLWSGETGLKVFGKALSFDGSDCYVDVVNPGFEGHTVGSVAMWICLQRLPAQSCLLSYFETWDDNLFFFVDGAGDLIARFTIGGVGNDFTLVTGITVDTWFHVAVVQDGTMLRGYRDGVPGTPQVTPLWFNDVGLDPTSDIRIGRITVYAPVDGIIDEPRVYSRGLAPLEVLSHYRVGARHLGRNV